MGCTRAPTGAAPPRSTSASTRSTACWSWDARSPSASPDPGRGRGRCARDPDRCNTVIRAADQAGRDLADPVHDPSADSPEPGTTLSGGGQPTSSAPLRPEPAVEILAPDSQP